MNSFVDHPSIAACADRYMVVHVQSRTILESWRKSLFSFEWLTPEGAIRSTNDLPLVERDKRLKVEGVLKKGGAVERPVLGIGLLENVEIGAGRDVFLTLAASGHKSIEVHIPRSNLKDFKPFLDT